MAPLFLKGKCSHCVHCLLFICLFNRCRVSMERKVQKGCSRGALMQQRRPKDVPPNGRSFSLPLSFSLPSFLSLSSLSLSLPFPHSLLLLCMFSLYFILLHSDRLTKLPYNLGGDRIPLGLWGLPSVNKEPFCQCGVPFCVDKMQSKGSAITQLWIFRASGF